jgi:valyl-tRNA synthetase
MKCIRPILSLLFIVFTGMLTAQDEKTVDALLSGPDMRVEQRQVSWLRNDYTAHTMFVLSDEKTVQKEFEKFIRARYKVKFNNARGWREAPGVLMADLIAETITFAFSTEKEKNGTRLRVIMDLGGVSVNARDYPQAAANLENLLGGFARSLYASIYADAIDEEKKTVKTSEKELKKLKSAEKKHKKDKKKAEKQIAKLEKELKKQRDALKEAEDAIKKDAKELADKEKDVKERNNRIDQLRKRADKVRR